MGERWRECYIGAIILGVVGYCLGPSLVGLRTLLSVSLFTNFYPWIALHGNDLTGHNGITGDTIDAGMSSIKYLRSQWFSGHLAGWQGLLAGGGPFSGVPDMGLLDPLSLPYFVLPLWLAPAFVVLLEFVVAIGGSFLFLRRLSVSRPAAMLAGLIFSCSGFMVMWTNWPQVRVAALIPALFWSTERLVQRLRLSDIVLVAVVVASMLFGGFPAVTGYALYLAAGYLLVRLALLYRAQLRVAVRGVALAASGLILGALLAMVQMLPFYSQYTTTDFSYRGSFSAQGLPASTLLSLFSPDAFGSALAGRPSYGPVNPVELVAYVGSAALVLAVAGAAFGFDRRRRIARGVREYFLAGTIVILLLGWLSPTVRSVVASLPVISGNFIGRIRSVLGFTLAVLAAIGFDWLTLSRQPARASGGGLPGPPTAAEPASTVGDAPLDPTGPSAKLLPPQFLSWSKRHGRAAWAIVIWIGAVLLGLAILRAGHRYGFSTGHWHDMVRALWIPAVLLVGTICVLALSRLNRWSQTLAFVIVPLLVGVQGAQFFHSVLPGDSVSDFYPVTPTHQFLASHLGHDRFAAQGQTLYPATSLYYDLRTTTGHVYHETGWKTLLQAVDPKVMQTPTNSAFTSDVNQNNIGSQPILDLLGVKYFVLSPDAVAGTPEALPAINGSVTSDRQPLGCSVSGQPIRGILIDVKNAIAPARANRGVTLNIVVRQGLTTITSGRYFTDSVPAGEVPIGIAGEGLSSTGGPISVAVTAGGAASKLVLNAHNGAAACSAIAPLNDHLRLVYADSGSLIYQRLDALPRIRWAGTAAAIPNEAQRVAALEHGVPANEVVLDKAGPAGSGLAGQVTIDEDSGDAISAEVSADGAGYLVVADAMQQPGWSVTVDGKPAHLVAADEGVVGVPVPAGHHIVRFHYAVPGQIAGAALSGLAVVVLVAILVGERLLARRRSGAREWPSTR